MKIKRPNVPGGNSEADTAARSIFRYTCEELRQTGSVKDAKLNTFCFLAGVMFADGVTIPMQVVCLFQLWAQLTWSKLKTRIWKRSN